MGVQRLYDIALSRRDLPVRDDLAEVLGPIVAELRDVIVTTGNLNLAVRRNRDRFPEDFMFQLAPEEAALILQSARAKGRGGRRTLPYVFTEHGVAMLSSVLNSEQAVQVNIAIMRAFARLREILATHKELARKLDEFERKLGEHDDKFQVVFEAIRQLMTPPEQPRKGRIGFRPCQDE